MQREENEYAIRQLSPEHNSRMLEILRGAPITSGGLKLCFDKSPDIFTIGTQRCDDACWVGLFLGEQLLGFGMLGHHEALIDGTPTKVFYYGNLYLDPKWRGAHLHNRLTDVLFDNHLHPNERIGYSLVMLGNQAAKKHIGRKPITNKHMPHSKSVATLDSRTIFMGFAKKMPKGIEVRKATSNDVDKIVELLRIEHEDRFLGLVIDRKKFLQRLKDRAGMEMDDYRVALIDNRIVGVCGAWDCSSFKQTRVFKYRSSMLPIKAMYQVVSPVLRLPQLPSTGEPFKDLYVTDVAIENRNVEVMDALLASVYNDARREGYHYLVMGSYEGDPLLYATQRYRCQSLKSTLILAAQDQNDMERTTTMVNRPFVDMATV